MPDVAMHHAFGREVLGALPEEIRKDLRETPFVFALYGPDLWFMYRPGKLRQGRGRRMHTTRTGAFLMALADRARSGSAKEEVFSYLAGFLCHYALDSAAHPYIVWRTTETWPTRRAHRDMEHALDAALLKREGFWGEKHPVTDHHFPKLKLPESMDADLDLAYGSVYGWRGVRKSLNRCYRQYRKFYRLIETPRSLLTGLAALVPTHRFRSLPYVRSAFLDRDVENLSRASWSQPGSGEGNFTDSFPDLYASARENALRMISAAWEFARAGSLSGEELKAVLGNRSYLSGLDAEDPRNWLVRSLMPPED